MALMFHFTESAIEMFSVCCLLGILRGDCWGSAWKTAVIVAAIAGVTTLLDRCGIEMNLGFNVLLPTILFCILYHHPPLGMFFDVVISSMGYLCLEMGMVFAASLADPDFMKNDILITVLLAVIALVCLGLFRLRKQVDWIRTNYFFNRGVIRWLAFDLLVIQLAYMYVWDRNGYQFGEQKWLILLSIASVAGINLILMAAIIRNQRQKDQLRKQREIDEMKEELIDELASKQHEFAKHLEAIGGLAEQEDSTAALVEVRAYLSQLNKKREEQPSCQTGTGGLVPAFLRKKKEEAERQEIQFDYISGADFAEFPTTGPELIEIIGNLMNNAFEAVNRLPEQEKKIYCEIGKNSAGAFIKVINSVPPEAVLNPEKMFQKGYSTKEGNHRGYGLAHVKAIVEKYRGKLEIYLEQDAIIIRILFP